MRRIDAEMVEDQWNVAVIPVEKFNKQVLMPDFIMAAAHTRTHCRCKNIFTVIIEFFEQPRNVANCHTNTPFLKMKQKIYLFARLRKGIFIKNAMHSRVKEYIWMTI